MRWSRDGAAGKNRTFDLALHTNHRFRGPAGNRFCGRPRVRGLDHPLTVSRLRDLGPARLASTPSLSGLARDRLGLAALGFPDFERFAPARFRAGRQSFTKGALYP